MPFEDKNFLRNCSGLPYDGVLSFVHNVETMSEQISQLTKTVESLNQTIQKLQEQLNKNSKNSSKPPSSDGFKKATC